MENRATGLRVALCASIICSGSVSAVELNEISSFNTERDLCGLGVDGAPPGSLLLYDCFGETIDRVSFDGTASVNVPRPGEAGNNADVSVLSEPAIIGGVRVPARTILFTDGERFDTEIFAIGLDGSELARTTLPGATSTVGGVYHPTHRSLYYVSSTDRFVEADTRADATELLVVDTDPFNLNFGDVAVCADTGHLFLASSVGSTVGEFSAVGELLAEHELPAGVSGLSGIAMTTDFPGEAWVANTSGVVTRLGNLPCGAFQREIVSSVLPSGRSVQVDQPATAFATMINASLDTGTNCRIEPITAIPGVFSYQTTDPATNAPQGTADTPVQMAPGAIQTFLFSITPNLPQEPVEVRLSMVCDNLTEADIQSGLNTLLLSSSFSAVPDVIALSATVSADGVARLTNNAGAFSIATANVGASGDLIVTAAFSPLDIPSASISVCQTDPATSECLAPPVPADAGVAATLEGGSTLTFGVFVSSSETIDFDPAANRIVVNFTEESTGLLRGSTSVAVTGD